jgi:hypothetical protein
MHNSQQIDAWAQTFSKKIHYKIQKLLFAH